MQLFKMLVLAIPVRLFICRDLMHVERVRPWVYKALLSLWC